MVATFVGNAEKEKIQLRARESLRAALGEEREKEDRLKLIKQTFLDMMDEDLSPFPFLHACYTHLCADGMNGCHM